jgi:hypothetical protein
MKHIVSAMILATLIALSMIVANTGANTFNTSSTPNIYVSPVSKSVQIGQDFTIDIDIDYVENLYGYEVWMNFDNNKLNASAIDYDGFLNEITTIWHQEVNNTGGYVALAMTSLRPAPAKTGGSPPPLATVHFKATGLGTSTLHLNKTLLADNQAIAIPHTTADGVVICSAGTGHDIAITNVIPRRTIAGKGYGCNITVATENHGAYAETYNITLYANETEVTTKNVTVPIAGVATVDFTWNTSNYTFGGYTMWAYAWPVLGETNTLDNNFTDGQVLVLWPGDIQLPYRKINMLDIAYIAKRFSLLPSDPLWDPNADINNDGKVDMKDVALVAKYFALTY